MMIRGSRSKPGRKEFAGDAWEQTLRFISRATIIHAIGAYFNGEELPSCCQRVRD